MDVPGVSFFVDNKKIFPFPLLPGMHQSKMPPEFQGVPVTGSEMDSQCFLGAKDGKQNSSFFEESNSNFIITQEENFAFKKGMCGHLNNFSAISISQLVGGFVGSKSQIRSVSREACQIWDVIFRQLAETTCHSAKMQNNTNYNFNNSISQNIFDSFCHEGGSTLDGIASFFISRNCESVGKQEMVHNMSESKSIAVEPPLVLNSVRTSDSSLKSDHLGISHLKLGIESSSSMNTGTKQSYAEVAKSTVSCKSDNHNYIYRPFTSVPKQNCPKPLKKMRKKREDDTHFYRHSLENSNWRERNEPVDCSNKQQPSLNASRNKQCNNRSIVYPAFNCKNRSVSSKSLEEKKPDPISKQNQNNFKYARLEGTPRDCYDKKGMKNYDRKVVNKADSTEVPQFGRKFRFVSKDLNLRMRNHKGRKYREKMDTAKFNSVPNGCCCGNWRCKRNGVIGRNDCEKMATKKSILSRTDSISQLPVIGCSDVNACKNPKDSPGNDSSQGNILKYEQNCADLLVESSGNVSSSVGDISDKTNERRRFLSECSVDSEDSFIMFESDCADDTVHSSCDLRLIPQCSSFDSDSSDGWSECSSDDDSEGSFDQNGEMDEIEFCIFSPPLIVSAEDNHYTDNLVSDKLRYVNRKWNEENACLSSQDKPSGKVHFANDDNLASVQVMVKWDFAYRAARCGPWEEMARDRSRFQARIDRMETILAPVLTPEHRCKVQQSRDSSAVT